jgi:hypothetical protein
MGMVEGSVVVLLGLLLAGEDGFFTFPVEVRIESSKACFVAWRRSDRPSLESATW